jgi:hypothetical protein
VQELRDSFCACCLCSPCSMFDLSLCRIHHSRTPSLASSHFVAFLSSFFSAFWRFLLSRHFSFLTLAITSSLSVNILFCSLAPPGCSKIGICTLLSPNVGAVCNLSRTIGLGTVRGHPYKWLLKSLLRHLWEQYTTSLQRSQAMFVLTPLSISSPHAGHQLTLGVHSF